MQAAGVGEVLAPPDRGSGHQRGVVREHECDPQEAEDRGQEDADLLLGGEGDDRLIGGAGMDEMSGGAGRDVIAVVKADAYGHGAVPVAWLEGGD
mgnify:CR=1 FL=1